MKDIFISHNWGKDLLNRDNHLRCKELADKLIKNKGRLLVRLSGTEPKIRIMCESFNKLLINKCINIIKRTIN